MIIRDKDLFILDTRETTYCFRILPSGHPEHLYYGRRINLSQGYEPLTDKTVFLGGTQIAYSKDFPQLGLENLCLEMSAYGKGDIREPFIEITFADGSTTCDFLFQAVRIFNGKQALLTLPSAYFEEKELTTGKKPDAEAQITDPMAAGEILCTSVDNGSLEIELYDKNHGITLILVYSVFYESNVITRSARVINNSDKSISLDRIMSSQLDMEPGDYVISTFHGAWAREMNRYDTPAQPGIVINDTKAGISSNRSNPFFMVSTNDTTEDYGDCYGFNLIYSGSHYAACEVSSMDKLRVVQGIQPSGFGFLLQPGEAFEAPEAVLTYSHKGFTGMSHNMHRFIRHHIVRGEWKFKERPVLVNSWEANYFKFNEGKLIRLAKAAKEAGVELFVLDDGWFGRREDDTSSLGDWKENRQKLGGGLKSLSNKMKSIGLDFGIWVEPEMVNEDSDLYRLHPDWAVRIPGMEHSTGRNQMFLDLTREEVRSYIIEEMSRVFTEAAVTYVKWDMNRIFSDRYSASQEAGKQKEFNHRYIMGLYQILDNLTKRFPHILFEGCASGGNRFDLGMLCYMPQLWASDNTDAICRAQIQTGCSYGYPQSVIGAHVSDCPNHQTLRNTSLDTRFTVAAFGLLGYELNLAELNAEDRKTVSEQISFYKEHRKTLQFGDFYRLRTNTNGVYQWMTVAADQSEAVGLYLQKEVTPNEPYGFFKAKGLQEDKSYRFTNQTHAVNIKEFGGLINMISPVHIRKDSIVHNIIAKLKKMPGETEECTAYGGVFMHAGIKLKAGFAGTGYNEEVRFFQDYAARVYLWKAAD